MLHKTFFLILYFLQLPSSQALCYLKDVLSGTTSIHDNECQTAIYSLQNVDILPRIQMCGFNKQIERLKRVFSEQGFEYEKSSEFVLPNLIGLGVEKGGTSALYQYLAKKKEIYTNGKQLHFFDKPRSIRQYSEIFNDVQGQEYILEFTPDYIKNPPSPCVMSVVLPDARLLLNIRDPILRFMSKLRMEGIEFNDSQSFLDYVDLGISQWATSNCRSLLELDQGPHSWYECHPLKTNFHLENDDPEHVFRIVASGVYLPQIKWWLQFYDKSRFWIIDSKRMYDNTKLVVKELYDWLGLNNSTEGQLAHRHATPKSDNSKDMSIYGAGMERLYDFYRPYVVKLRKFLVDEFGQKYASLDTWPIMKDEFAVSDYFVGL